MLTGPVKTEGNYEEALHSIETLLYHLESRGLTQQDLEPYIGSRGRVADVLNRRRALTIAMIRRLHNGLRLPADSLIQPYTLNRQPV